MAKKQRNNKLAKLKEVEIRLKKERINEEILVLTMNICKDNSFLMRLAMLSSVVSIKKRKISGTGLI